MPVKKEEKMKNIALSSIGFAWESGFLSAVDELERFGDKRATQFAEYLRKLREACKNFYLAQIQRGL